MVNNTDTEKELGMVAGNKLVGSVRCRVLDKDGNVVFEDKTHNNILVNIRQTIVKLLAGNTYTAVTEFPYVNSISLGTGDTPNPDNLNMTALEEPIAGTENLVRMSTVASDGLSVTFAFLYGANVTGLDDVEVKEMGLWDRENRLIARTVVGGWTKTAGLYFEVYWTIGYAA